jgi:hypothetical protein
MKTSHTSRFVLLPALLLTSLGCLLGPSGPVVATPRYPRGRLSRQEKWVLVDLARRPQTVYCFSGRRVVGAYPWIRHVVPNWASP